MPFRWNWHFNGQLVNSGVKSIQVLEGNVASENYLREITIRRECFVIEEHNEKRELCDRTARQFNLPKNL